MPLNYKRFILHQSNHFKRSAPTEVNHGEYLMAELLVVVPTEFVKV